MNKQKVMGRNQEKVLVVKGNSDLSNKVEIHRNCIERER